MENLNKLINTRCNALKSSKKRFEDVFNIMFDNDDYILGEYNDGYSITSVSFKDARKRINEIAYTLANNYNLKDQYIGIAMESCIEWIEAFWGILKSGNKPYLINLKYSKDLINKILKTLNITYIVGIKDLNYDASYLDVNSLKLYQDGYDFVFGNEMALSTSATTLKEKIIFYNGNEISNQILNCEGILKKNKQIKKHYKGRLKQLVFLPLYHIFGFTACYMWFSFFGRTMVFLDNYSSKTILNTVKLHEVTHIFAVPLLWNTIANEVMKEVNHQNLQKKLIKGQKICLFLQRLFPSLGIKLSKKIMHQITDSLFGKSVQFCISGGSYIKNDTLKLINLLGYPLYNGYGMTEIGITSVELGSINDRLKNSIGYPFDSIEYKIVDGNLYVQGSSIAHKIMINKEVISIDGWFNTCDCVSVNDDGRYFINGRVDDLIIGANGENINPDLIEKEINIPNSIRYSLLSINDALSLVIEISEYLSQNKVKMIYDELCNNKWLTTNNCHIYFTYDHIANENAIKVSRQYLLRLLKDNKIKLMTINDIKTEESNQNINEGIYNKIVELIAEVLHISKDEIKGDSNFFFDLNGTSLDYFSLISTINDEFNIEISFENDSYLTPNSLSKCVEELFL